MVGVLSLGLCVVLAFSGTAWGSGAAVTGTACLVETSLNVNGVLLVPVDEPPREPDQAVSQQLEAPISMSVVEQAIRAKSCLRFLEQRSVKQHLPEKNAERQYREAEAILAVNGKEFMTRLPVEVGAVKVRLAGVKVQPWLAEGFLSQAERDLLSTPFDPLLLSFLSPRKEVKAGDQWVVDADAVAGLLCIDTVTSGQMLVSVEKVVEAGLTLSLMASIVGAVDGVSTEIELSGNCDWVIGETTPGDVTQLEIVMRESRQPGHVGPGLEVEAALKMTCHSITETTEAVNAERQRHVVLPDDQASASAGGLRRGRGRPGHLWFEDRFDRFNLVYSDNWRMIEQGPEQAVFRLVDQGALIGQVTIRPLPPNGTALSLGMLQQDIERSLAGQFGHLIAADESQRSDGTNILRVASVGEAAGLTFRWFHYHLSGAGGHRVSLVFMVESKQFEQFAVADRRFVEGLCLTPR